MNISHLFSSHRGASLLLSLFLAASASAQRSLDLAGSWTMADGKKANLPGSMLTNDLGDEVTIDTKWTGSLYDSSFYFNPYMAKYREAGKMKFPFFLTPRRHYVGEAWYERTISIPRQWKKGRVELYLERPHIETTVYVNGKLAGRDSSLSVPHSFDITQLVLFGKDNQIKIRVYNGIENVCVGQDSHSVTDQTQGNWNGIAGDIRLISHPKAYISNLQVYPNLEAKGVGVDVETVGLKKPRNIVFLIDGNRVEAKRVAIDEAKVRYEISLGDSVRLWNEFTPNLYTLSAILDNDTTSTTFGMREISYKGRQLFLNGNPLYLRGTVENCNFPLTGFPPADEASWLRVFQKCKEYGINHVRFHSYCPPEAAFFAADKLGIYLQPEGPSWPNHGVKLRRGMTIDHYLLQETQRMVRQFGNHPSFCMLAAGNEPAGDWVAWCRDFINYWHKTGDNRRVYCGASVGGGWAWDANSDYHVKGGARGLEWNRTAPSSDDDYYSQLLRPRNFNAKATPAYALAPDTLADGTVEMVANTPILAHEQGQWCAFPDLRERSQYTGVYKASNFDIFEDLLQHGGMATMADKFLASSSRLQQLAYKYEMERNLRTPEYSGFQLLGLNDYSGQGTALVGPLNVFWREKSWVKNATDMNMFRHACKPVVPLARFPRFVYTAADTLVVPVELYNASASALTETPRYTISGSGVETISGVLANGVQTYPVGKNIALGTISLPLNIYNKVETSQLPQKLQLQVAVGGNTNEWDFWVYPSKVDMPKVDGNKQVAKNIYICDSLDAKALAVLKKGGKVLIQAAGRVTYGSDVKQTYLPIFWNTSWFKMRPPHTTGSYINASHPVFANCPTDDWQNLNWWELVNRAQVMNLAEFPADYQSPFQPIDTWHVSRKLGMIAEANVLGGKLLITTFDISSRLDSRLVARQLRKSILDYMLSDSFAPSITIEPSVITDLFTKHAPAVNMFTNESPDELKPKIVR